MLDSFDIDYIELETLMWQAGYLTITHTETILDNTEYHLAIPNKEVTKALLGSVADFMMKNQNSTSKTNGMLRALLNLDFIKIINGLHIILINQVNPELWKVISGRIYYCIQLIQQKVLLTLCYNPV